MSRPFRHILLPIDFAEADKETPADLVVDVGHDRKVGVNASTITALKLARDLAEGGTVRLLHATPDMSRAAVYGGPDGAPFTAETLRELNRAAEQRSIAVLQVLAQRYCEGVAVAYSVASGQPNRVVLATAEEHQCDAIILGTSGRGAISRTFLGSTADKIIRQAMCPVIVLPEHRG
jgi:nucleotide-binding universal stress UspA family protein